MSLPKTLEQGRAEFAFSYADNKIKSDMKDKFKSHVKSFPMLVKTNGLGAAIAFLFSKGDKEQGVYKLVAESIVDWLKKDEKYKFYGLSRLDNLKSLTNDITKLNSSHYRALTNEVLAYFTWLRRFAEGLSND
jgi:CRISPR-associated protein Cmr5